MTMNWIKTGSLVEEICFADFCVIRSVAVGNVHSPTKFWERNLLGNDQKFIE